MNWGLETGTCGDGPTPPLKPRLGLRRGLDGRKDPADTDLFAMASVETPAFASFCRSFMISSFCQEYLYRKVSTVFWRQSWVICASDSIRTWRSWEAVRSFLSCRASCCVLMRVRCSRCWRAKLASLKV